MHRSYVEIFATREGSTLHGKCYTVMSALHVIAPEIRLPNTVGLRCAAESETPAFDQKGHAIQSNASLCLPHLYLILYIRGLIQLTVLRGGRVMPSPRGDSQSSNCRLRLFALASASA
jgi:hypothetical protein